MVLGPSVRLCCKYEDRSTLEQGPKIEWKEIATEKPTNFRGLLLQCRNV